MRAAPVHKYIKREGGDWIHYKAVIYKKVSYANSRVNDNVVGLTELGKTQRKFGLLCAVLKEMSYNL